MSYESTFLNRSFAVLIALAMFFTSAAIATADSPAELLEKAIYVEETVGDLDKAIEGYRKVLSATESTSSTAAEAQYRIGACLTRQGKAKEATEAFQKVVDDYQAAKAWVERANSQLSALNKLLSVPWGDGDEMHMHMKLPGGLAAGYQVFGLQRRMLMEKPVGNVKTGRLLRLIMRPGRAELWRTSNRSLPSKVIGPTACWEQRRRNSLTARSPSLWLARMM